MDKHDPLRNITMSRVGPQKGHTMDTISFTQAQYIHLCKVFPELVGNANTTNEEYRIATGQRQVVS